MRIHSNTLTFQDLYDAANAAGPRVDVDASRHGSRSRAHAFEVALTGTSNRRPNSGTRGADFDADGYAATWDEWGMFFAVMFDRDPDAACWAYSGADDFHGATGDRFRTLTPDAQHRAHRWRPSDLAGRECPCGAVMVR